MTHPSPTALEEIRKRHDEVETNYGDEPWDENCVEDGEAAHKDRSTLLTHIAALEAERDHAQRGWHECMRCLADKTAEAQLSTRLPDRAKLIAHFRERMEPPFATPETLAQEGFMERWKTRADTRAAEEADAILALLSGAATPAPTAALTEEERKVMGTLEEAQATLLEKWRVWTQYTSPTIADRKTHRERDAARREAEVRLREAAATVAWHLDRAKSTPQGAEE